MWIGDKEQWIFCAVEQWLLDKAKAECGYCFLALVKVGFAISKDIMDFINHVTAQNDIKKYENQENALPQQYTFQPIYKKGTDLV